MARRNPAPKSARIESGYVEPDELLHLYEIWRASPARPLRKELSIEDLTFFGELVQAVYDAGPDDVDAKYEISVPGTSLHEYGALNTATIHLIHPDLSARRGPRIGFQATRNDVSSLCVMINAALPRRGEVRKKGARAAFKDAFEAAGWIPFRGNDERYYGNYGPPAHLIQSMGLVPTKVETDIDTGEARMSGAQRSTWTMSKPFYDLGVWAFDRVPEGGWEVDDAHQANYPRENPAKPLPAQEAAEVLCAQLGPAFMRMFSEEDVFLFTDYCVAALRACPEDIREMVSTRWERSQIRVDGREYTHIQQGFALKDGKVHTLSAPDMSRNRDRGTHETHERVGVDLVKAHTIMERSISQRHREIRVGGFADVVSDVLRRRDFPSRAAGATRHYGPKQIQQRMLDREAVDAEDEEWLIDATYREMEHLTTAKDVEEWCERNARVSARVGNALSVFSLAGGPTRYVEVKEVGGRITYSLPAIAGGPTRYVEVEEVGGRITYSLPAIAEYASGVVHLLGLADELESAGWEPEYLSLQAYGKLCTWLFTDADGPWGRE